MYIKLLQRSVASNPFDKLLAQEFTRIDQINLSFVFFLTHDYLKKYVTLK